MHEVTFSEAWKSSNRFVLQVTLKLNHNLGSFSSLCVALINKLLVCLFQLSYLYCSTHYLTHLFKIPPTEGSLTMGETAENLSRGLDTYSYRQPLGVTAGESFEVVALN